MYYLDDNYADDFDGSDRQKNSFRDENSSDEEKSAPPKRSSSAHRKQIQRKYSSESDDALEQKIGKKTWQIKFFLTNIPKGKYFSIKFSLISKNQNKQTEIYEITKKQFDQNSKEDKQYSFKINLKDIGKPEEIKLKIYTADDDDDENDDDEDENIRWYLDHVC